MWRRDQEEGGRVGEAGTGRGRGGGVVWTGSEAIRETTWNSELHFHPQIVLLNRGFIAGMLENSVRKKKKITSNPESPHTMKHPNTLHPGPEVLGPCCADRGL